MNGKTSKKRRQVGKPTRTDILWWARAIALCVVALILSMYPFRRAFEAKNDDATKETIVKAAKEVYQDGYELMSVKFCVDNSEWDAKLMEQLSQLKVDPADFYAPYDNYFEAQAAITKGTETVEVDEYDKELLALVIYQEAGADYCSDDTRRMVGEVVLNRVADDRFPDTIEDVLLQKQQYGRLYWSGLVWSERASLPEEADAVARAYRIAEELLTSDERLLPEDTIFQSEWVQGTEIVAESDGIYFCK